MKRFCAWVMLAASGLALADGRPPLFDAFDIQVPWSPAPVTIAGKTQLVYEVHLSSFAEDSLVLERVDVVDKDHGKTVASLEGEALRQALRRPDHPAKESDLAQIPAGVRALVYLSVPGDGLAGHRIEELITYRMPSGNEATVHGGAFTVGEVAPVRLGPPLRGGPWTPIYSADWQRGHRRVLYAVNGKVHVPGRFAVDWIKVDDSGKHARGDGARPADWFGYGEDVLAVADATVVDAKDGMAEPERVSSSNKVPMENASGNFIALDLGQGRYVFYEHLKPASIKVHLGDKVKRGQVIGLLGYTGSTTGPHLHLHVSDGKTPLDAEGLPYAFDAFDLLGAYASPQAFGDGQPWVPIREKIERRTAELPAPFSVVNFTAE
ncbi:M23 family metallopeptidase [Dyella subtropica]|uniref:M23 family metallopeptidase n=1 Tax=Dyella subtropica TaxID=2992127 RepID=UPI0022587D7F|nr:M23 family metallopeptidase [Dyella subtropica]